MAGIIPTIGSMVLTPAEVAAGFSAGPTGLSLPSLVSQAFLDLQSAYVKLATSIAAMPAGANKTVMQAQLAALLVAIAAFYDGGSATSTDTDPALDGGTATSIDTGSTVDGGTATS
jgi:hypothetical protein